MACLRGDASPDMHTRLRLFAASGGFCQNPACSHELFMDEGNKPIHIAEMAHVFAANDKGPRAKPALSEQERGAFENLILLCPTCHTKIDKAPDAYPDDLIFKWKRQHAEKLNALFGVKRFENRRNARKAIEGLLRENRQIFEDYGPHIDEAADPESGAAERWHRKMLHSIIPNNRRLLAQSEANKHLLSEGETKALEQFRQHIDDLEARHLEDFKDGASRFPAAMSNIFKE